MKEDKNFEVAWSVFFSPVDTVHETGMTREDAIKLARSLKGDEYEQAYARPIGGTLLDQIFE